MTQTRSTRAGVAVAAGALLTLGAQAFAQSSVTLYGTVRDFRESHPDFGLPALSGFHSAGNVGLTIEPGSDPAFTGAGFRVDAQWYEKGGNEIAPHLYNAVSNAAVRLVNPPSITNNPTIDTFDPALGAHNPSTNSGPMPNIVSGATMPPVPPTPTLLHYGDVTYSGNATSVLSASMHCTSFTISDQHRLEIQGDVTIVTGQKFVVENYSKLLLGAGATLTVFAMGDVVIQNHTDVNVNAPDYTRVTIYNISAGKPMVLENNTKVYANLVSPDAPLVIKNTGDFYGSVAAKDLDISNNAGLHIAGAPGAFCAALSDTAGVAGSADRGSITDATSFGEWFRTIPGVNADGRIPLTFTDDGSGVLEFSVPDLTPIDAKLYGNESDASNRNFTLEVRARFRHTSCSGGFLEFSGDGDVWVFIDDRLVIDLAGPVEGGHQYIDIDRLGLADDTTCTLALFYAQRTPDTAPFSIRTNLPLRSDLTVQRPTMSIYD